MATGADRTPSRDGTPTEQKGKLLQPSTAGILKQALGQYLAHERDFVDEYFPEVALRGYSTYGDVFGLTVRQADALRLSLVESIRHFRKQAGRDVARNTHLLTRESEDPNFVSFHERKAKLWTEALRDLCKVFGLESPL